MENEQKKLEEILNKTEIIMKKIDNIKKEENKIKEVFEEFKWVIQETEKIRLEIGKLRIRISRVDYEEAINKLFDKIKEVTRYEYNSVLLIDSDDVKYICRHAELDLDLTDYPMLIIDGRTRQGYYWSNIVFKHKKVEIHYDFKYDIPDDVIDLIRMIPDSPIEYAKPPHFKLYHILKQWRDVTIEIVRGT
jgi:regulator of replication initiation timing